MQITRLNDTQLLTQTKQLAQQEREVLTKILHHLREIERRKLFSDLGYGSLFEYAVKELSYSEGQAGRRIQAMRLMKEIPQLEKSIASGELSLSNVAQAQSLFRNHAKANPKQKMRSSQKAQILASLKGKSTREAQKELLKLQPQQVVSKSFERERQITAETAEVRFLMSDSLKAKLENVRALLGPKAIDMGYAELIEAMAELSAEKLAEHRFGKKRVQGRKEKVSKDVPPRCQKTTGSNVKNGHSSLQKPAAKTPPTPAPEKEITNNSGGIKGQRYIPQAVKHAVWLRDKGQCQKCRSRHNLQFDHVRPLGLGGNSSEDNIRLLCFHCNQRQAMKTFGVEQLLALRSS